MNLCFGGSYHFDVPDSRGGSVFVGVARDCGEEGAYCAVAIDALDGATLDRQ